MREMRISRSEHLGQGRTYLLVIHMPCGGRGRNVVVKGKGSVAVLADFVVVDHTVGMRYGCYLIWEHTRILKQ